MSGLFKDEGGNQAMNKFSIFVGIMQLIAAAESELKGNHKMAVVFACYGVCSIILAFVK